MDMENRDTKQKHYAKVYRADRWAARFITAGGYGIIASIIAIMLFLVYQSLPLGKNASLGDALSFKVNSPENQTFLTGVDPYQEIFYTLSPKGDLYCFNLDKNDINSRYQLPLSGEEKLLTTQKGNLLAPVFAVGTDSGRIITAEISMKPEWSDAGRTIVPSFEVLEEWQFTPENDSIENHIETIAFVQNEDISRFWAWLDHVGGLHLRILDGEYDDEYLHDLSEYFTDTEITALTISHNGESLVVATRDGDLYWFSLDDFEEIALRDKWRATNRPISALAYLLGDQAIVVGGADGSVETWFPIRTEANWMKFQKIHTFEPHAASIKLITMSSRNRNFLTVDDKGNVKLHYSTSGSTEFNFQPTDYPISTITFSPKSDAIVAVDAQKNFSLFPLDDPHPETTTRGLFGKVWYEGYQEPEFVWQSTGGSDEFEPKLSLIPLIFGTLKGTLYAMLFSIPIAILAAIYVSQFSPSWLARMVKPTVEIMAALPSVVIGFLAGLYFSPLFEDYLTGFLITPILLPVFFIMGVLTWRAVPEHIRSRSKPGQELLMILPLALISIFASLQMGPLVEHWFFGGNIQQWIYGNLGITYETRNSLVVGFALGFAVIPIIFTMTEDALTNVPDSLSSASLALGASRWQTVRKVILPAASGGIFAATMLGLGRAVGETMIVLMATGNTPILDLNPFNGFRAMSACIAVEIPEAPVGGSLYRVLFMTALLLFLFTFVLNTLSSIIGERLRKKYARF